MAVSLYFGLPGCGKTTLLTAKALKAVKSGRYRFVYSNVRIAVPGVTYIDNECIGVYDLRDALILIDEGTLFADSRDFKNFKKTSIEYFLLHRHYNVDIIIFTQQWNGVDLKIRVITDRVYYVYKGLLLGYWFTSYYRIPYGIIIPDPHKANGEKLGDIVQGYCKPNIFVRIFSQKLYRPRYYKYFDSWEAPPRPALPADKYPEFTYMQFAEMEIARKERQRTKRAILLRSYKEKITGIISWIQRKLPAPPFFNHK